MQAYRVKTDITYKEGCKSCFSVLWLISCFDMHLNLKYLKL
jgi:hypothetical protein